ncbi:MAG: Glu/Leu/Phe/Val dehydrogenase dimerization domain-containing protein [bacterium]
MSLTKFDNMVIHVEKDSGYEMGYVVIDSIINNTSSGGVRIVEDVSLAEIKALAREMTLKFSFAGLNRGGAKCGIQIPDKISDKERASFLMEFGRKMGSIIQTGIYFPGRDMNCSEDDLRAIYRGAGFTLGKITDTSYFTAISLENAIMACKEVYNLRHPISLAIEGFGNVGRYLAERLDPDIFRIVALSTVKGGIFNSEGLELNEILEFKKRYGDEFVLKFPDAEAIEKESILTLGVDILIPCARTWSINENNVQKIKACFIVPAANAPYTQGALNQLDPKKTTCLPGFVCNSGGVYASSMFDNGVCLKEIEKTSETIFRGIIRSLLDKGRTLDISPVEIATLIAMKRFERKKMENGNPGIFKRVKKKIFSKGRFPKPLYRALWVKEFKANLIELEKEISEFQNQ